MKKDKKVEYVKTSVTCSCGNTFEVESNKSDLHIEVCDKCHPFFTGVQGQTMKAGKVEKFNRKYGINQETK
ncbi:MAG: 50S ribosomal protein L31 [Bacilli bacterium]|nr:50S ribosomal protein L31 [Bacilli bacterium]MDD4282332.1 50S ribosomal protein L31 [Bacilli bacterium]MDD4718336.1 50S ribosomal protein L31 [Bacilli bacterium]